MIGIDRHMSGRDDNMTTNDTGNMSQSNLVTVAEAAAALEKSDRTIRRMIRSGKLPTVDIGGKLYVQLAGSDNPDRPDNVTRQSVIVTGKCPDIADKQANPIADALRDTIRRQDAEISYLRNEAAALRTTLDKALLMLPAMKAENCSPRGSKGLPLWTALAILAGVLIIGGMTWLMK